jgi:hypothetical protein
MLKQRGNVSIILLSIIIILSVLLLTLYDLARIYTAREETKNAADSIVLAVSQNLLYFEDKERESIAEGMAAEHDCELSYLIADYDEVEACAEKQLKLFIVKLFFPETVRVRSVSRTNIIYPWDFKFNYCQHYKFDLGG